MLRNYYDAAILSVREVINGVDKLQRFDSETAKDYLRRRRAYLVKKRNNGRNKSKRIS